MTQQSWLFLLAFLALFFFFCWEFSRLHFGRKVFGKVFRILGLDKKKGRWVVEQDYQGNFGGNFTWLFVWIESYSFWYGLKGLFTLHKLADKVVLDRWNWWYHKQWKRCGSAWAVQRQMGWVTDQNFFIHWIWQSGPKTSLVILCKITSKLSLPSASLSMISKVSSWRRSAWK